VKIRFVGHASFSVESSGTTLITDPWLVGKAFNSGWALLSPPARVDWTATRTQRWSGNSCTFG
jgi:L-ascorbate metabolism protein UlaG (beta-lactamase superfamily)